MLGISASSMCSSELSVLGARPNTCYFVVHPLPRKQEFMDQARNMDAIANYGAEIVSDLIARSESVYIYTESGRRILDWTSGQVRELLCDTNNQLRHSV